MSEADLIREFADARISELRREVEAERVMNRHLDGAITAAECAVAYRQRKESAWKVFGCVMAVIAGIGWGLLWGRL